MTDKFRKLAEQTRATPRVAVPQVNPEDSKPVERTDRPSQAQPVEATHQAPTAGAPERSASERPIYLTTVDTKEKPINQGFHMYPSRHEQVNDLAYIEKRKPWQIIEDALEEYVVKRYGKEHKRK